jgi:hypothetical protein
MGDYNKYVVGGQITPEGRELGLTDDDLVGGQIKLEAVARLDEEAEAAEKKAAKKEAKK